MIIDWNKSQLIVIEYVVFQSYLQYVYVKNIDADVFLSIEHQIGLFGR